jgi:hypothetical protein
MAGAARLRRATAIGLAFALTAIAGSASAADVTLWEGESTTRSSSKQQVVRGSVKAVSSRPGVATVSKPRGDNAEFTITGVKKGEAVVTITGKLVVYNVGVNQKSIRTEVPFETQIGVVVKKPETYEKLAILLKRQQLTVDFPKHIKMVTKTLKNSNKKVCRVHVNTNRKVTIFGKEKGESQVTVKLQVTKKKKTKTVKGIIHVEVKEQVAKSKERKVKIAWDDLYIGRIVIVNGDEEKPAKRKARSPSADDLRQMRDSLPRDEGVQYVPYPTVEDIGDVHRNEAAEALDDLWRASERKDARDRQGHRRREGEPQPDIHLPENEAQPDTYLPETGADPHGEGTESETETGAGTYQDELLEMD